jgi:hypothetical protein
MSALEMLSRLAPELSHRASCDANRITRNRIGKTVLRRVVPRSVGVALIVVGAASCHDATAPPGADARLVGSALTQVNPKTAVCHAAGSVADPKFVEVRVGGGGAAAHLGAGGTSRAGHEGDYLVTARTPCPPPPTGPNVRVCKAVNSEFVADRIFEFDVNGEPVSFRGPTCAERTFRVGTPVTITETIPAGLHLQSIDITPPSAGTGDIARAIATVVAGIDVAEVTFANHAVLGQLTICKQVEPVGLVGRTFTFFVTVFRPLDPGALYFITPTSVGGPPGFCVPAGSYPLGTVVYVVEEFFGSGGFWFGVETTSITVVPADRLWSSPSLFFRQVGVTIGEGTTQVRYVNARRLVELRICKVSPPGFTATTRFHLDIGGADGPLPPVDVPANGCALVTETGLGWPGVPVNAPIRIAEVIPAGQRVAAITVDPSGLFSGLPDLASGIVLLGAGRETTTVTFHNVWTSP